MEFQKNIYFCFIDDTKASDCMCHNKLGRFLKRWEYHTTLPASWETCMQVKKQQLELNIEQQSGSKSEKEYEKAVYCHPAYLTYMESTSYEMLGWMKQKLESRLPGETAITSDKHMIMAERGKLKSLLMKVKEESENVGLKLTIKKLRSWHLVPSLHSK